MPTGLRVRVLGNKAVTRRVLKLKARLPHTVAKTLNEAAYLVRRHSRANYLSASGEVRRGRRGPRLIGRRSPPDKLGPLTGQLKRKLTVVRATPRTLQARMGTSLIYGEVHEVKGAGAAKVKRPFLSPALEDKRGRITRMLARGLAKEVRKA